MDIYTDYANWKVENFDLLNMLLESDSVIISRFKYVIKVIDHLYSIVVEKEYDLSVDEEYIFETGFEYLHDHFEVIKDLYKNEFNNNILEMEKLAKSINLLLYVMDFEAELLGIKGNIDPDIKILEDLEDKIISAISKKENVEDGLFLYLDEVTTKIFESHKHKLTTIDEIFYQVAETYNLVDEEVTDIYNDFINEQIEVHHHEHKNCNHK